MYRSVNDCRHRQVSGAVGRPTNLYIYVFCTIKYSLDESSAICTVGKRVVQPVEQAYDKLSPAGPVRQAKNTIAYFLPLPYNVYNSLKTLTLCLSLFVFVCTVCVCVCVYSMYVCVCVHEGEKHSRKTSKIIL